MTNPELTPEYLTHLLANGYTDEVRAVARRLQSKPDLVMMIERVLDDLVSDATIDWEGRPSQEDFFLRAEQCLEETGEFDRRHADHRAAERSAVVSIRP